MKKLKLLFLILLLFTTGCVNTSQSAETTDTTPETEPTNENQAKKISGEVIVLAAASLTDALNEIITNYGKLNPDISVKPSYAGSGALQAQIEEGAPADIFMSASPKQMDALQEKGLIREDTRTDLLQNEVVLIKPKDGKAEITGFEDAANDTVTKIAIADPASVPVGQYSEEIFTNLKNWDDVKKKMVMSRDVRNTLDWVASGEVDCGTVYKTDAVLEKDKVEIIASAPENTHKNVVYPVSMIRGSEKNSASEDFFKYLCSDEAKKVYENYGFSVN